MKSDLKASSQEVLAGLVERVTFHNEPPAPEAPPALRPRTQNPHRSRRAQPNSALSYPRFPPYEAFGRRPRAQPRACKGPFGAVRETFTVKDFHLMLPAGLPAHPCWLALSTNASARPRRATLVAAIERRNRARKIADEARDFPSPVFARTNVERLPVQPILSAIEA